VPLGAGNAIAFAGVGHTDSEVGACMVDGGDTPVAGTADVDVEGTVTVVVAARVVLGADVATAS
jgi:hypothetical protein